MTRSRAAGKSAKSGGPPGMSIPRRDALRGKARPEQRAGARAPVPAPACGRGGGCSALRGQFDARVYISVALSLKNARRAAYVDAGLDEARAGGDGRSCTRGHSAFR
eukprot:8710693-Pyramimonas_sp.AAC.1